MKTLLASYDFTTNPVSLVDHTTDQDKVLRLEFDSMPVTFLQLSRLINGNVIDADGKLFSGSVCVREDGAGGVTFGAININGADFQGTGSDLSLPVCTGSMTIVWNAALFVATWKNASDNDAVTPFLYTTGAAGKYTSVGAKAFTGFRLSRAIGSPINAGFLKIYRED